MTARPEPAACEAAWIMAALASAPVVRVAIADPAGGEIEGAVTAALSATHVRVRADDGLVWAVPLAALRILAPHGGRA